MTGIEYVYWQVGLGLIQIPGNLKRSPVIFTFGIIRTSTGSVLTLTNLLLSSGRLMSSGVQLAQGRVTVRGKKPAWALILKIRAQNFGAAISISNMLLSMNFEERLTYPTYYDGWISIQSVWRPKVAPVFSPPPNFGSRQTSTRSTGTHY